VTKKIFPSKFSRTGHHVKRHFKCPIEKSMMNRNNEYE